MTDTNLITKAGYPTKANVWEFLRAVLGDVILLLLMVGAEHLFFDRGFFASLIQHPFWIIVLIAAVHDGLFVGVAVAIAATVLMDWPARPAEADITAHYIQVAILPLQWIAAALCIGLFRQAELRRAMVAEAEMARLRQVNDVLATDITNIEAEVTRIQLATLLRDGPQSRDDELVSRIRTLQGADRSTLAQLFGAVADLCTPLPATILLKNATGEFEPLDVPHANSLPYAEPPLTSEHVMKLRTMSEVIIPRTASVDGRPEYQFTVLVGVTSPDHRTLYGAVALLAIDRSSADNAVGSARFLASQLAPVLARTRVKTGAISTDHNLRDTRVRKMLRG